MIWEFDEEYIKDTINELDEYISSLKRARDLLERLINVVDICEASRMLWEISEEVEYVLGELESTYFRIESEAEEIGWFERRHR